MRSRTGSLPRSRWRSMERSSPPAPRPATAAWRARRSATRAAIASWLARRLRGARVESAAQHGHGREDSPSSRASGEPRRSGIVLRACSLTDVPGASPRPPAPPGARDRRLRRRRRLGRTSPAVSRVPRAATTRSSRSRRAAASASTARAVRPSSSNATGPSDSADKPPNVLGTIPADQLAALRRGDQADRLRAPEEPAVHRRVPDQLRRPGVHLRVRRAGRHRTDRDLRGPGRLRLPLFVAVSTALGPFVPLPTT